jgi:hypothetical protein
MVILKTQVDKIRKEQDKLLLMAKRTQDTLIVPPAFQWAQDLNSVAINVKWANRPDSPACTNAYDENVVIEEDKILVEAMCDKLDTSTKYLLEFNLFTKIDP